MLHFVWSLSHNSLALRVNLKHKGMKLDPSSVLCGRLEEDEAHLFFKCKCVKGVWAALQLEDVRSNLAQTPSAMALVWEILKPKDNVQRPPDHALYCVLTGKTKEPCLIPLP
jgi:hypothetical protein